MENQFWPAFWTAVPICLTIVSGFILQLLDRRKSTDELRTKIRESTEDVKQTAATEAGKVKAAAELAAQQAKASLATNTKLTASTAEKVEKVALSLNGALDNKIKDAIENAIAPIKSAIEAHQDQDEKNMLEIRGVLSDLAKKMED